MAGRVIRGVAIIVMVLSLVVAVRVGWVAYGPRPSERQLAAQVRFLDSAIEHGAGPRMQQLFPEGEFFLTALAASAATAVSAPDLVRIRGWRDQLDTPQTVAVFGSGMVPEHGIFQAGWSLTVAVDLAADSQDPADRADVARRAELVEAGLRTSRTGFLEAYPQQYWPCDTVVAASALARAAVLLHRPDWLATVRTWRGTVTDQVDPATGLLPHRVDGTGRALEGPRGSSQSIIQAFWPALSQALGGTVDRASWDRFRELFIVREAGLVGVREFPRGTDGAGDVDSGPLIFGVSASASVVALAAARGFGDNEVAAALDREAELLGLPASWGGERRYALGVLPVGDAFLAWARSRPAAPDLADLGDTPRPLWPVFVGVALLPALVIGALLTRHRVIHPRSRP